MKDNKKEILHFVNHLEQDIHDCKIGTLEGREISNKKMVDYALKTLEALRISLEIMHNENIKLNKLRLSNGQLIDDLKEDVINMEANKYNYEK